MTIRTLVPTLFVLFSAAAVADAKPLPEASPSPSPSPAAMASPAAVATPDPAATATPPPMQDSPMASPTPGPEMTPVPATTPMEPLPAPTPYDYTGGMPGSAVGSRRLRIAIQAGLHGFVGDGWNDEETTGPGSPLNPPQTEDYPATAVIGSMLYDVTPLFVLVGAMGGHTGNHTLDDDTTTITYSAWHGDAGVRLQTPANKLGLYLQTGAGLYAGLKQIDAENDDLDDEKARGGVIFHVAGGGVVHVARGLDFFVELRGSRAPGEFEDEDPLDLGGITATAGLSLRL